MSCSRCGKGESSRSGGRVIHPGNRVPSSTSSSGTIVTPSNRSSVNPILQRIRGVKYDPSK